MDWLDRLDEKINKLRKLIKSLTKLVLDFGTLATIAIAVINSIIESIL